MRILIWETIRKELESTAAFNMALFRAIDPRIITHRPRDPEKARLMKELGIETSMSEISRRVREKGKKSTLRRMGPVLDDIDITIDLDKDRN